MANNYLTHGKIGGKYKFPWYMPYKVDLLRVKVDSASPTKVTWECPDSEFTVWFPQNNNPLVGSNEVYSKNRVAEAQVKPFKLEKGEHKKFFYGILLTDTDKEDVVEGNSPPTMIIE